MSELSIVDPPSTEPHVSKAPGREKPSQYDVGYGKPPKETRFKKGASGNPRGRAKKEDVTDLRFLLDEVLAETVTVRAGGRNHTMTKLEAMLHAQKVKALGGDKKATAAVLKISHKVGLISTANRFEGVGGVVEIPYDGEQGRMLANYRAEKKAKLKSVG